MQLQPRSQQDLIEIVRAAGAENAPLALSGHGTKQDWGRPGVALRQLSLCGFSGIADYAPAELVLTAGAGTPLAVIQSALKAERQHLAFEPPDLGPLFGKAADDATIGGVIAANLSGPRRPFAGAARDFFLGFSGVNGQGEGIKAGGKVVKNVTGYDLPKLIAGSFGTLVALTEVTIKVVPAPETSCSVIAAGLDVAAANRLMTMALASTADPSAAAFLPNPSQTIFRLEGSESSVAYRCQVLKDLLRCEVRFLDSDASRVLWQSIRDLAHFQGETDRVLWLLSVPPAHSARVIARLEACFSDLRYSLDWGGGRIWLSHSVTDIGRAVRDIHSSLVEGGHATLLRAPAECRRGDHVFLPDVPLPVLQRVRAAFDPLRIFNRGRLHSEM